MMAMASPTREPRHWSHAGNGWQSSCAGAGQGNPEALVPSAQEGEACLGNPLQLSLGIPLSSP